jgi:hypothetical protein
METILNIYVIIDNNFVTSFKAKSYELGGSDQEKISFLKSNAAKDYDSAYIFDAPKDNQNQSMTYKKFSKLEKHEKQYMLFEEIFTKFKVPESPLICVTPVVDGKIIA